MSGSWSHGGQPSGGSKFSSGNRPPICFKCSQEGHFMINCPLQQSHTAHNAAPVINYHSTRPSAQDGNNVSSFDQPMPNQYQQYQQYPGPPQQAFLPQNFEPQAPPIQTPYPTHLQNQQQYGPPAPQYSYVQPSQQQPYIAPPVPQPYPSSGYQAQSQAQPPQYNQYSTPSGLPQFNNPTFQNNSQYGPPQAPPQVPTPYQPPYQPPYQTPPAAFPTQQPQNGNYASSYGSRQSHFHPPAPQQQWTAPHVPFSNNNPPFQRPPRTYSDSSHNSATPGFPSQQQFHARSGSQSQHQTPRTSSSNVGSMHQPESQVAQTVPAAQPSQSKASNRTSTPHKKPESSVSSLPKEPKYQFVDRAEVSKKKEGENQLTDEEQFDWDFRCIFNEPTSQETVALAQPLSVSFAMMPVPLLGSISVVSVSRYARIDNCKEFTKDIRNAPQWSFLKEDPAFAELNLDAPLIPICDIPAWTAARHGLIEDTRDALNPSRKRSRSGEKDIGLEGEQGDVGNQTALVAGKISSDEPPNKRQKNEDVNGTPHERSDTPVIITPVLVTRDGTPCLPTDDEAWAPQPGEGAASVASAGDPMEALLASLGVTGAPKPVKQQESLPTYQPKPEKQTQITNNGLTSTSFNMQISPQKAPSNIQDNDPQLSNYGSTQPPQQQFRPQNPPFVNPNFRKQQFGPIINPPYANGQHYQHHQARQAQFLPPANPKFNNMPSPNVPVGSSQYGPNGIAPYGNGQHGPQNGPQQPFNQAYGSQSNPPYYEPPSNDAHVPVHHGHPPQYQSGPPQSPTYNAQPYHNAARYDNAPINSGSANNFGNSPEGNLHLTSKPLGQQQYGPNMQNNTPFHQESGYESARDPYSNGSGQNGFANQQNSQPQFQQMSPPSNGTFNIANQADADAEMSETENIPPGKTSPSDSNDGEVDGSPLSPLSQEILGKLSQPSRKTGNGRKASEDARKSKRPAPVVAEAYSRRW